MLESLAQQIARDGEGAKKLVTIHVEGAANETGGRENRTIDRKFAAGEDSDRGLRSQLGSHSVRRRLCWRGVRTRKADIDMQGVAVCRGGLDADFDEVELKRKLDQPECLHSVRDPRQRPQGAPVSGLAISLKVTFALTPVTEHKCYAPRSCCCLSMVALADTAADVLKSLHRLRKG